MKNVLVSFIPDCEGRFSVRSRESFLVQAALVQSAKEYAFAYEAQPGVHYNFHIFLKESVILRPDALNSFLDCSSHLPDSAVMVGSVVDSESGKWCDGGFDEKLRPVFPDDDIPVPCDTFRASFVMIPSYVSARLGPAYFMDYTGNGSFVFRDLEYGFRLLSMDLDIVVAPGIIAETEVPCVLPERFAPLRKVFSRMRRFFGVK